MKQIANLIFKPFKYAIKKIGSVFYDLRVALHKRFSLHKKTGEKGLSTQKKHDLVFYIICFTPPLIMFVINQIIINGNSFFLAFRSYDQITGASSFAGFKNFKAVIADFVKQQSFQDSLLRSVKSYLILVVTTTILPIIFSYYIYKKLPGFKIFKIIMFLPSIIAGIITVMIFKTITEKMVPSLMESITHQPMPGLLSNPKTAFNTILFYSIWLSFGGGMLIQVAAMNTVDESVTESAKLEGVGFFQEFWYIVFPASYQIILLGFITGFASLFTNDLGLFAFHGLTADSSLHTIGYYFTVKTIGASFTKYPYYAAWGLITSAIAIPITLTLRHVIYKYGPSEE